MLAHRFEDQCERHEESITPAARARTSSRAGVPGHLAETLGKRGSGTPSVALSDIRSAVITVMLDERARRDPGGGQGRRAVDASSAV